MPLARFLTTVRVRAGPSTSTETVARYCNGDTVNYDKTVENEGRLWISYIARSGNRRYCCAKDTSGEWYIDLGNGPGPQPQPQPSGFTCFYQKNSRYNAIRNSGCCFLSACFLGGLNNLNECDDCFDWASNCGRVRKSDAYVNAEKHGLGREIAQRYGRDYRDYKIVKGRNHFYVIDGNGHEVFNSMGQGWGH